MHVLVVVCSIAVSCSPSRKSMENAASDASGSAQPDAWVPPDAPPPSVDAGPPPPVACSKNQNGNPHVDAGAACELPPSTCLDENYLVYYTSGTCVDGECQYEWELMYCTNGCYSYPNGGGGCMEAFT